MSELFKELKVINLHIFIMTVKYNYQSSQIILYLKYDLKELCAAMKP